MSGSAGYGIDEGISLVYGGIEFVFCSDACRREFLRNPKAHTDVPTSMDQETSRKDRS